MPPFAALPVRQLFTVFRSLGLPRSDNPWTPCSPDAIVDAAKFWPNPLACTRQRRGPRDLQPLRPQVGLRELMLARDHGVFALRYQLAQSVDIPSNQPEQPPNLNQVVHKLRARHSADSARVHSASTTSLKYLS